MLVVALEGSIETSYSGYLKLIRFYNECSEYFNHRISLDLYRLNWIDANLCSLFEAILYKLNIENKLTFSTDFEFIKENFDVLLRNGFIQTENNVIDEQKSTIPSRNFELSDKEGFCKYIEQDLMEHRGMPQNLNKQLKEKIIEDLIEVFSNSHLHAETTLPFFVAGQYYPQSGVLKFTMVDLGEGFLPKIEKTTNGKVNSSLDAIAWALKGNTTKKDAPGALGITGMRKYVKENEGVLDIITGDGYWSSGYEGTIYEDGRPLVDAIFVGTTINLTFKH